MSTATAGRAREHKVRDDLIKHGWELIARSAGSKGPADLVMAHVEARYPVLIQVGTANKTLGPAARARLVRAAGICGGEAVVAICATRKPIAYREVTLDKPSTWEEWTP